MKLGKRMRSVLGAGEVGFRGGDGSLKSGFLFMLIKGFENSGSLFIMVLRLSSGLDRSDENRLVCIIGRSLKLIVGDFQVWILAQLEMRQQRDMR